MIPQNICVFNSAYKLNSIILWQLMSIYVPTRTEYISFTEYVSSYSRIVGGAAKSAVLGRAVSGTSENQHMPGYW
jgi:hypothetical protein